MILFPSQKGFSLVEMMVGGALLAMVGLGAVTVFDGQRKEQRKLDQSRELHDYHKTLTHIMMSAENCTQTLSEYVSQPLTDQEIKAMKCVDCVDGKTDPINFAVIGSYSDLREIWRITGMKLARTNASVVGPYKLRLTYELNPRFEATERKQTRDIVFNVKLNDQGGFLECYDARSSNISNLIGNICLGFSDFGNSTEGTLMIWDKSQETCFPRPPTVKACDNNSLVVGVNEKGIVNCDLLLNQIKASKLITSQPTTCNGNEVSVGLKINSDTIEPGCI